MSKKIKEIQEIIIEDQDCEDMSKLKFVTYEDFSWKVVNNSYCNSEYFHEIHFDGNGNAKIGYNHAQGFGVIDIPDGMIYALFEAIDVYNRLGGNLVNRNNKIYKEIKCL